MLEERNVEEGIYVASSANLKYFKRNQFDNLKHENPLP